MKLAIHRVVIQAEYVEQDEAGNTVDTHTAQAQAWPLPKGVDRLPIRESCLQHLDRLLDVEAIGAAITAQGAPPDADSL